MKKISDRVVWFCQLFWHKHKIVKSGLLQLLLVDKVRIFSLQNMRLLKIAICNILTKLYYYINREKVLNLKWVLILSTIFVQA